MKNNTRNSGIGIVGNIPWGTHFSQFYQTKEDLFEIIIPHFKAGFENNESCLWITSDIIGVEEAKKVLAEFISDIDTYFEKGQIEIIPFTDFYSKEGILDSQKALDNLINRANQALISGYDGLRLIENISWLKKEKLNNFISFEQKLDSLMGKYPIIALCTYSLDMCSATEVMDIVANHQFTLIKRKGKWDKIESSQKNITKCKTDEKSFDYEQSSLESITQTTDFMLALFDLQFNFLWVNSAYAKSCHMKPEEMVGKNHFALYPHEENEAIFRKVRDTGEEVFYKDKPFVCPDQPERGVTYWDWSLIPVKDSNGNITGLVLSLRETTKYKLAEEILKESEERYRMLFTNMTEGFVLGEIIFNENGKPSDYRYLEANPAVELQAGVKKEKLLGKSISEIFPNPDPIQLKKLEEVVHTGQPTHLDYFSQALGKYFEIYIFSPEKGKIAAIFRDITERRRVEKALQKSEERYRMLFTNMIEGFGLVDVIYNEDNKPYDYRYLEINPTFELFLGMKREQLIGKTMRETFPNLSLLALQKYNEVALLGQPINFEIFSKVANRYLDINAFIPEKGKVAIILRDITERKKDQVALQASEEQYRAFFENSMDAVLLTSPDGTIYAANPAAQQIFGMTEEEIIQAGRNGIVDLSDPRLKTAIEERARTGKFKGELNYRRKDGTIFPGEVSSAFFKDKNGLVKTAMIVRDVTEQKQAEEALRFSEQKFAMAFANNPAAITLTRLEDGLFLDVNDKWIILTGYSRDEAIGHSAKTMQIWPTEKAATCFVQELREKGYLHEWEQEFYNKSGGVFTVQLSAQVLAIQEEKLILSTMVDITDRKRAEEELRKSENRFRVMFEEHGAPMLLIEPESGQIIDANEAAARFYEYSREQLRKMYIDQINQLPPEEVAAERYNVINRSKNVFVFTHRLASGDERLVEVYSSPVTIEGRPTLFSIIHDITLRKKAEEALKKVHDTLEAKIKERTKELEEAYNSLKESKESLAEAQKMAHIGNWEWDLASDKFNLSDELYRIFGFDPKEVEPSYNKFLSYIHPEDLDYVVSNINQALNGKPYSTEYRIILPNGEERTLHMESEVIFDEKNNPTRIKGIIQDITERKQAAEALEKIEIARKKEIHHRIKNNLQVISSLLDLQAEQFRDKECIEDSEVLEAFRESQDRVISMALIHEELYRGGGFETLNFSSYIQELAENLFQTYRLGDTNISLKLDLAENAFFDMDIAVPLGMIVNELVSNSLKHAFIGRDDGEIRIELFREESTGFECEDCESTSFILTIYDNGMGIPELEIKKLDSLGMQLVTSLVDQLDGELEVKRDNGTEFIIRFTVK